MLTTLVCFSTHVDSSSNDDSVLATWVSLSPVSDDDGSIPSIRCSHTILQLTDSELLLFGGNGIQNEPDGITIWKLKIQGQTQKWEKIKPQQVIQTKLI